MERCPQLTLPPILDLLVSDRQVIGEFGEVADEKTPQGRNAG